MINILDYTYNYNQEDFIMKERLHKALEWAKTHKVKLAVGGAVVTGLWLARAHGLL
jgi:hypothetical protein